MEQYLRPRPRFPPGVYAPPPRFFGNNLMPPPSYQFPQYVPDHQNYYQPQPQPQQHLPHTRRIPRDGDYVPNLPLELWPAHLHRIPFAAPRPHPPNLYHPCPIQRGRGPAPQFVVGHGGYLDQTRGGPLQPYQNFNSNCGPVPPPSFASRFRPPPPYPQPPHRGNATGPANRRLSCPLQRHQVQFRNGYPIIPQGDPPRSQQQAQNQDLLPDSEESEPWYDNEDEVVVAFERKQRNNTLMNSILDEEVVNCEPNFGGFTRVESLKRQVGLLENAVKKETECCDEAKRKCETQMNSFKEGSDEFNRRMEDFSNQNYEEMSDGMVDKLCEEIKAKLQRNSEEDMELGCGEGEDGQDPNSGWKEGIYLNNVEGWRPTTLEEGPGYEALELLRNRSSNVQTDNTTVTSCPDTDSFTGPPFPPTHQNPTQQDDGSLRMHMLQHPSQHSQFPLHHLQQAPNIYQHLPPQLQQPPDFYQPPPPQLQQPPQFYQPPPPQLQQPPHFYQPPPPQLQQPPHFHQQPPPQMQQPPHFYQPQPPHPQYEFEHSQEHDQGHQEHRQNMEKQLRAARLRMYLKLILEEKYRREQQTMLEMEAQNPAATAATTCTGTTATCEHPSQPAASGVGPLPNSQPPEPVQQGRLSSGLMSGGGIIEVSQSTPQSPLPTSKCSAGISELDAANVGQESAQKHHDINGMEEHGEMEPPRSQQLDSQKLRLNAPTLAKLLEAPCLNGTTRRTRSYSRLHGNMNSALYSALTGGGGLTTGAANQDSDSVNSDPGQIDDQKRNGAQDGDDAINEPGDSDARGINPKGNDEYDNNMESDDVKEITIGSSEDDDDDSNLE